MYSDLCARNFRIVGLLCPLMVAVYLGGCHKASPPGDAVTRAPVVAPSQANTASPVQTETQLSQASPAESDVTPAGVEADGVDSESDSPADEHSQEVPSGDESSTNAASPGEADSPGREPPDVGTGETANEVTNVDPESPDHDPEPRFMLFTPDGPLVVEINLSIHGKPHAELMESILGEALALADTDGDGRATWEEIFSNERFARRFLNQLPLMDYDDAQRVQFVNQYDTNGNGSLDRLELPSLLALGNQGGASTTAFSLQSSNEYRNLNRYRSGLLQFLDVDLNGSLSADEIDSASVRLRSRDYDLDDTVELNDVLSSPLGDANRFDAGNTYDPVVAQRLDMGDRWNAIHHGLRELYARGGRLTADSFPLTPDLYPTLDADQNGRLSATEYQKLAEIEPDLRIEIAFGRTHDGSLTPVKLLFLDPQLEPHTSVTLPDDKWLILSLPTTRVVFFASDLQEPDLEAEVRELVQRLDANQDGYLEADEWDDDSVPQYLTFASVDKDGDEKIYPAELVSARQSDQSLASGQVHARIGHQPDALFVALDTNLDGRLNPREIDAASQRLVELDQNADGRIDVTEFPDSILVAITRGEPQRANRVFRSPPRQRSVAVAESPRWFRAMDRNADGEISQLEFLGTVEQFGQIDGNRDGYLDADEARSLTSGE
ncbi:MAG: hypothetical protein KDA60_03775 [Planctomycetales bacterium]|nr:hypothetical protein [Planctomycetales bacterium]